MVNIAGSLQFVSVLFDNAACFGLVFEMLSKTKTYYMPQPSDEQLDKKVPVDEDNKPLTKEDQQKSDPQITELKGFIDPNEKLEVEGTDNPV